ncbi:MAG: Asp23/Gls24 family envelope stress response protein [Erysipelotrichaceae bacterium]|nr:Asp23/Gls24 family envelope stress response protein [Erysipelotrichaceae bacterium]
MAMEYIVIPTINRNIGLIAISKHVLEAITRYTIEEEDTWYLGPATPFHQPVTCKVVNNKLSIVLDIRLKYGVNVNSSCEQIQRKIQQMIEQMTDIKCNDIKINVVGFLF